MPPADDFCPALRIRRVKRIFAGHVALAGVDLDIPEGQRVALIGPSGSGKTTLLRIIAGLDCPDDGHIEAFGQTLGNRILAKRVIPVDDAQTRIARRSLGMVFQHFNLFPHLTAIQNVMEAPMHVLQLPVREARSHAEELLAQVGLSARIDAYPDDLSGGEQQRVAIARALAMRPRILLLDEITASLDPEKVREVLDVIRQIAADTPTTMLIVTHEMAFAREVAHRTIFMERGSIVEDAPSAVLFGNPRREQTRSFLATLSDLPLAAS
jgi:polar amino acid transport system ATP-binding protein